MANADQAMELQCIQVPDPGPVVQIVREPNPDELRLLEHLTKREYAKFETKARVGLANEPPTIDINYVYPEKEKTVLDIASSDGLDEFVQLILNLGADPNKVNVFRKRSPLHFAAEAGNFGVLEILLNHPAIKPNLEVKGRTALHLAVNKEKVESVEVLLKHNADLNIVDSRGLTPLHVAAMRGHEEIVELLIRSNANVRCVDNEGNTALHYAAMVQSSKVISRLLEAGSYIGHENALGIPPITEIDPETISRYLDNCLWTNEKYICDFAEYDIEFIYQCRAPHVKDYEIEFNYKCLSPIGITNNVCTEMQPFLHIAKSNSHRHLLKHPILSSFLFLKWRRISPILWVKFFFHLIFYYLLNSYILLMTVFDKRVKANGVNTMLNESIDNDTSQSLTTGWKPSDNLWYPTAIVLVILVLREMVQLILSPRYYFLNYENWLELLLIYFSIGLLKRPSTSVSVLAILLSAWKLTIYLGQYGLMLTAIEMLKTVTKRFIHIFLFYVFLIFAFAFAFFTLFKDSDESSFLDPGQSLFKTIIMLTGEFDANGIPFVSHPLLSHLVFILFVFLIAIVMFNLLNGLAVSDTAKILSEAELVGLISITKLVAYAESIFSDSPISKNRWCCRLSGFIQRMIINFLRFALKNILFFPDLLSDTKIRVKPLQSNAVLFGNEVSTRNTCLKLMMDRQIITHAKEIISRRGRVSDYQKISDTVNQGFDKIALLIRNYNQLENEN